MTNSIYVIVQVPGGYRPRLGRIEPRRIAPPAKHNVQYVQLWSERRNDWVNGMTGYHKSFIRFATYEEIVKFTGVTP